MEFGNYARYAVVTISGFLLFFMGVIQPLLSDYAYVPLFIVFLLTVIVSFHNKTPLGGLFYGIFTSASFLIGNLISLIFVEVSKLASLGLPIEDLLRSILLSTVEAYLPEITAGLLAFATLGFFFGMLGYVFNHTSPETILNPPWYYRDYWSSILSLGRSDRREYNNLDRRFSGWDITKKSWWQQIASKISIPQPDLFFMPQKKGVGAHGFGQGDLYDLSTGKMLGSGLVDPSDVISKYRPFVLKIPEFSTKTRGVRRLAFETLLSNFLEKIVPSKMILPVFAAISAIYVFLVYLNHGSSPIYALNSWLSLVIALGFSLVIMFFVWRWRDRSRELFKKRPDERLLILIIYIIFVLIYGFAYPFRMGFPPTTADWTGAWLFWIGWSSMLSVILGLGYIFIHREVEAINTYYYSNPKTEDPPTKEHAYKDPLDAPFWLRESDTNDFWVIRFLYYWRYELAKVPHPDWERVELWVDAATGDLKWVVSDYHYREMWYRVKDELSSLYISFFINFHTPIPVLDKAEVDAISKVLKKSNATLLKVAVSGKSQEIIEHLNKLLENKFWQILHPSKWVSDFGLPNVAAGFSSKLPWTHWRYPHGLEKPEDYIGRPAARIEDQPKTSKNDS